MPDSARYQARIAAGLCTSCGSQPARSDGRQCAECAQRKRTLNAERAQRLARAQTCGKCGAEPVADGRMHCTACLAYFATATAARKVRPRPVPTAAALSSIASPVPPQPVIMTAPVALSRRQVKEADRVGGIELMVRYPATLGPGPELEDDEECDATPAERKRALQLVGAACDAHGLVVMSVVVARVRVPKGRPVQADMGLQALHLAIRITGRRWVQAKTSREPLMMFAAQ